MDPPEKYGIVAYAVVPTQSWNTPIKISTSLGLRMWVKDHSCEAFIYEPAYIDKSLREWWFGYGIDSLPHYYHTEERLILGERVRLALEMLKNGKWQIHYAIPRLGKDYYVALPEIFDNKTAKAYVVSLEGTYNCYGDLGLNFGFEVRDIALIREPVYPVNTWNLEKERHQIEHYGGEEEVLGVLLQKNNLYLKPCIPPFTVEE